MDLVAIAIGGSIAILFIGNATASRTEPTRFGETDEKPTLNPDELDQLIDKSKWQSNKDLKKRKELLRELRKEIKPKEKSAYKMTEQEEFAETMQNTGKWCIKKMIESLVVTSIMVLIGWYTGGIDYYLRNYLSQ